MAHPHLELIASSRARVATSAERIRRTSARLRVVRADPNDPPLAPEGSYAVMVKDECGNVISYGWTAPVVDRETFYARACGWADMLEAMPACPLRAVP